MKINTITSLEKDTTKAVEEIIQGIESAPDLILVYYTYNYSSELILEILLSKYPDCQIAGSTTCLGVMTREGMISNDGTSLAVMTFGFKESEQVGVGLASDEDGKIAGEKACESSIVAAGLEGELPDFIWLVALPGKEESVIDGIEQFLGSHVPIFGGSAGDNEISGKWKIFGREGVIDEGAIVISFFTNDDQIPVSSFRCGYTSEELLGTVTNCSNRIVKEIDNQKAFDVYNEKVRGALSAYEANTSILAATALIPLGRIKGKVQEIPYYLLSHPYCYTDGKELELFTEIEEGDELYLMTGDKSSLKTRAKEVVDSLIENRGIDLKNISGALFIYCAGCMLSIVKEGGIDVVASGIRDSLGDVPFLGAFTCGEQGCFIEDQNLHGNLMISVTLFFK